MVCHSLLMPPQSLTMPVCVHKTYLHMHIPSKISSQHYLDMAPSVLCQDGNATPGIKASMYKDRVKGLLLQKNLCQFYLAVPYFTIMCWA